MPLYKLYKKPVHSFLCHPRMKRLMEAPRSLQCASSSSPQSSCFFRVLLPGFSNRLKLPAKFVTGALAKEKAELRSASVVNPVGESWHVEVYKYADQEMSIGGLGWSELARAHNLGVGYVLFFQYRGDMVFDFRAFDLSTCEIAYPSIAQWVAKKLKGKVPLLINIKEEGTSSNPSNVSYAENKEKGVVESNCIGGVRFETKLGAYHMSKGNIGVAKKLKGKIPILINIKEEEEFSNPSNVSTVSDAENKEKGVIKSACVGGVRFEKKLGAYHMAKGDLNIPTRFKESSGLWEQVELSLKDPKGRLWTIKLRRKKGRPGYSQRCTMSKGWLEFARANKLKDGDRCIFKLVSQGEGKENVLQVKILKKCIFEA